MSAEAVAFLHYAGAVAFIGVLVVAIIVIATPPKRHHCDRCEALWEAGQGALIMGGIIIDLDAADMAVVQLEGGDLAQCSIGMLRGLYAQKVPHA